MDANITNRFAPYEAFTWNQNPMNVGLGTQGLFPAWNQLNHQLINHVTPSFDQDTHERTPHAIPAADNLMATPSTTSNPDVDSCQSNRHNFYGTPGI